MDPANTELEQPQQTSTEASKAFLKRWRSKVVVSAMGGAASGTSLIGLITGIAEGNTSKTIAMAVCEGISLGIMIISMTPNKQERQILNKPPKRD